MAGAGGAACEASFSGFLLSSNAEAAVLHIRSPSTLVLAPRRLPGRPPANKFDQALRQRAFILKGCCYGNGISTIQDHMLAFRLTAGWSVLGQCKTSIKLARPPECLLDFARLRLLRTLDLTEALSASSAFESEANVARVVQPIQGRRGWTSGRKIACMTCALPLALATSLCIRESLRV